MDWNIFWTCFWQIVLATPMLMVCIMMLGASLALVKALGWGPKTTVVAEKPTAGVYYASPFDMERFHQFMDAGNAYRYLQRLVESEVGVAGKYDLDSTNLMTAPDGTVRINWRRVPEEAAK